MSNYTKSDKIMLEVSNIINDMVEKTYHDMVRPITNKMIHLNHEFQGISPNEKYGLSFSNYDYSSPYYYDINIENQNFIIWNLSNNKPLQCNIKDCDVFFSMNCINYLFSDNDKYLCIGLKASDKCKTIVIDLDINKVINVEETMDNRIIAEDILIDTNLDKVIFSNDEKYLFTLYDVSDIVGIYTDVNSYHYIKILDILRGAYIYKFSFDNHIHSVCFNNDNSILTLIHTNYELLLINLNNGKDYICNPIFYQDVDLFEISFLVISGKVSKKTFSSIYYFKEKNHKYQLFIGKKAVKEYNFNKNENLLKICHFYDLEYKNQDIVPNNPVDRVFLIKDLVQHIAEWV